MIESYFITESFLCTDSWKAAYVGTIFDVFTIQLRRRFYVYTFKNHVKGQKVD